MRIVNGLANASTAGAIMSNEARRFQVYVVRLKNSVWKQRKYREANPDYQPGRPHVYVGSTGKTPEERFAQHMAGEAKFSPIVRRFGKKLFPWAYRRLPSLRDRRRAERLEERVALRLRRRGWGVWYNARPLDEGLGEQRPWSEVT